MRIYFCLVISFLMGCTYKPEITRMDGSTIAYEALNGQIGKLVEEAGVTGLAVCIFNDNEPVFQKAFGWANADTGEPLRMGHIFYGASLSKAVFGFIVARLALDGVLDLDKPLQDYLDIPIPEMEFEKAWRGFENLAGDERYKKITARMCMSHTTGLPNWRWIPRPGEREDDGKLRIYFEPGSEYSYSGEGMMLLQYVIERITGQGLEQLAQEMVFRPLAMDMTSYLWRERFESNFCVGHTADGKTIPKDRNDDAGAAGSMETTPEDYARFLRHILELANEDSDITRLMFSPNIRIRTKAQFGPLTLEETDQNDDIQLSYGLGWGLLKSPYGPGAFKEGHDSGWQHYSILFPERQTGMLIMSNSDNAESIFKALLEVGIGDTFTPWEWENYIPYDE